MISSISPLTGTICVNKMPAYRIERFIGSGGSAMCYLARKILADGSLGAYVVIKEFCPAEFDAPLRRREDDGVIVPVDASAWAEFEKYRHAFAQEAELCRKVNTAGKSNSPWVLPCEQISGREDLLLIATEEGMTVHDFLKKHGQSSLSRDYVLVCLLILSRLLEALRGVHRCVLHLDVSPKNVYLSAQGDRLDSESTFAVKLFDLGSARPKADCTPDRRKDAFAMLAYTPGYNDPALESGGDLIDERSDWYSAAAVFYTLLTGEAPMTEDPEFFLVLLPRAGVLENDLIRSDIEAMLNRALKLEDPYTEEDIEREAFARQVSALIAQLRYMSVRAISRPDGNADSSSLLLLRDEEMQTYETLEDELIDAFAPMETEAYRRQNIVSTGENGPWIDSLAHAQETMHEARRLFDALEPWFAVNLPGEERGILRDHLLIAAKLHDVGVAGSEEDQRELYALDRLYMLANGCSAGAAKAMTPLYRHLSASPEAELVKRLCAQDNPSQRELQRSLIGCRRCAEKRAFSGHPQQSARFILDRHDALAMYYGGGVDFAEVALLVALHEGGEAMPEAWEMVDLLRACGAGQLELKRVESKARRIRMGASILRLANARRSGSNMVLSGKARPIVHRSRKGRLSLLLEEGGVLRQPQSLRMHDALLCAKLVECGAVSLEQTDEGWQMTHRITLAHADTRDAQALVMDRWIPSYIAAIRSTLLAPQHMRHVICVSGVDAQKRPLSKSEMNWLKNMTTEGGFVVSAGE